MGRGSQVWIGQWRYGAMDITSKNGVTTMAMTAVQKKYLWWLWRESGYSGCGIVIQMTVEAWNNRDNNVVQHSDNYNVIGAETIESVAVTSAQK